ncbi:hypothetical protein FC99_GL001606 [Levilactobacillus koreensis JCM 16448]|uniref:DUF4767 domain-containing protein n=1 Tax=Levilactobacillus koreensis TaxID=637971 RepID=A0AAC8UV01_9LACO|nr:hypothetical protein [Levilactobacillus koreensis]AKP64466.1 hypothetical protein ABN16_05270 [Levilactobacillus koreensis]KRK86386.1 hypothetical protein FC99_GL001606 [Levilactobacillus koreensis JCM 16448]
MHRLKFLLLAVIAMISLFVFAPPVTGQAKVVWKFLTFKSVHQVPASLRGTWYAYAPDYKRNVSLTLNKKSFTVRKNHKNHIVKLAQNWRTSSSSPRVDFRQDKYGCYFYHIQKLISDADGFGMIKRTSYHHQPALIWYPTVPFKHNRVVIYTHHKQKHTIFQSTKHNTIVAAFGGK